MAEPDPTLAPEAPPDPPPQVPPQQAPSPAPQPPEPRLVRSRRTRISLVWLVPLLALAMGTTLVVRSVLQTGPRIQIEFRTAEGLEAGKTEVRYKEVVVGRVSAVTLSEQRDRVLAAVQLDRSAAGLAVDDTSFWVVRPRVGVGGISGIGTLLSGAYIGVDAGRAEAGRSSFVGLEAAPYVLRGEPGEVFILRAQDLGSLDVGSPIYYRRTRVGRVVGFTLDAVVDELSVKVFIEAPYQRLVTPHTRFWNASGVDFAVDANGLTVNTQSVAAVLAGGVAFEQPADAPRQPAAAGGSPFQLFADRASALAPARGKALPVRLVFDGSLRGLTPGAPIDFQGVEIGNVRSTSLQYDAARQRYPVQVLADLYPQRLGAVRAGSAAAPGKAASAADDRSAADLALLQRLVDNGLRAQLRTGNLLTGQLYVAMDFIAKGASAAKGPRLQLQDGLLTLPTVPGTLSELQSQAATLVAKLSRLPIDDIGRGLADTLRQTDATLRQADETMKALTPEARKTLTDTQQTLAGVQQTLAGAQALMHQLAPEAQGALAELRRTVGSAQSAIERLEGSLLADSAPLQRNLGQTLTDVQRAAQSLRVLTDMLARHPESLLRGKAADPALPDGSSAR